MSNSDLEIACADCGVSFTFTSAEQEFFSSKGYTAPKRCKQCRQARKASQGGGTGGGGGGSGYSSDRPPRRMHDVVCADCGQQTQVPFEPRGDKPVYCRDCFRRHQA